jgi:hypothetical protein
MLTLGITLLGISSILFVAERTVLREAILKRTDQLLPDSFYEFYAAESLYVHHLRNLELNRYREGLYKEPIDLMFTIVGNGKKKILIQGDSWSEQFVFSQFSKEKLESFGKNQDIKFTVAGVSSYSPSPMTAQINRLRSRYGIHADHVIAFIDQTDIGDELCRYSEQRAYGPDGLEIRPYDNSQRSEVYSSVELFENIKILRSENLNVTKAILLAKNKLVRAFQEKVEARCGWSNIAKPLFEGISSQQKAYLLKVFGEYINAVFADQNIKSLVLITFPHRNHLSGEYKLDVGEIVIEAIKNSTYRDKISYLRPPLVITAELAEQSVFRAGDPASHLTDRAHAEYLVEPLLIKLSKILQFNTH